MICQTCLRLKGIARCEGCQILFCVTCLTEHQNDLEQKFSEIVNERNHLVELFNRTTSTEIRRNFEKFSDDLRKKHKEKDFLENVLEEMRQQLENLRKQIEETSSDDSSAEQSIQTSRLTRIDFRKLVPELRPIHHIENTPRPYRSTESIFIEKQVHPSAKENEIDSQCRSASKRNVRPLKFPQNSLCQNCCSMFTRTKSTSTCPYCRDFLSSALLVQ